jgi:VanZ family protein
LRSLSFGLALILSIYVLFRPGGFGPLPFAHADKCMHAVTFSLLAVTSWLRLSYEALSGAATKQSRASGALTSLTSLIILGLGAYAVASEVIQHFFIPTRSFDLVDILADLVGAVAGLTAGTLTKHPGYSTMEKK